MSTDATPASRSRTFSIRPYERSIASVQFRPATRSPPIRTATGEFRSSNRGGFSGSGSIHRTASPGWYPWKWKETVVIRSRRPRPPVEVDVGEHGVPRLNLREPSCIPRRERARDRGPCEPEEAVERRGVELHPGLRVIACGDRRDQERPVRRLQQKEFAGQLPHDPRHLASATPSLLQHLCERVLRAVHELPDPQGVRVEPDPVMPALSPGTLRETDHGGRRGPKEMLRCSHRGDVPLEPPEHG